MRHRELLERAVQYYRSGLRLQIGAGGELVYEVARAEKAATYSLMALEAMEQAVFIAEQHGYQDLRELRSRAGGNVRAAVDAMREFLDRPEAWARVVRVPVEDLRRPSKGSDWGWIRELPYRWWGEDRYLPLLQRGRPYAEPERAYALLHLTLYFASPAPSGEARKARGGPGPRAEP